jgi:hypothetical protein
MYQKKVEEGGKPNGCGLIFCFFIIVLLGMLLVLFIKVKYFLNVTQTW